MPIAYNLNIFFLFEWNKNHIHVDSFPYIVNTLLRPWPCHWHHFSLPDERPEINLVFLCQNLFYTNNLLNTFHSTYYEPHKTPVIQLWYNVSIELQREKPRGQDLRHRESNSQGVVVVLPDTHLDTWGQFFIPPLRSICVTYYTNYSQNIRKLSSLKEVYIANNDVINCVYFKISNTLLNFSLHIYFF